MKLSRSSGILAHITSLPGKFGIGDIGPEAFRFIDFLASSGQRIWQILPLGPTGFGDSPYQSFSAFAGNPMLLSPEQLVEEGYLNDLDFLAMPDFPEKEVDFAEVIPFKMGLFRKAASRFQNLASHEQKLDLEAFCANHAFWLDDFTLFMSLKRVYGGREWVCWDKAIASRQPKALEEWRRKLAVEIFLHQFIQFQFSKQWKRLKKYAHDQDIVLFGDIPIFLSADSSDVWAHPDLFYLDESGRPTVVSGVPPDYFSETGQLWGNPIYRWETMEKTGYSWWVQRFQKTFEMLDYVRIDHFRGFEAYWEIPAGEKTAVSGKWIKGPGLEIFDRVRQVLDPLPIIAENLGMITPEVEELREQCGFPGMVVLQFAFSGADPHCSHLPHHYNRHLVAYTGTHDNDTTIGWWDHLQQEDPRRSAPEINLEKEFLFQYLNLSDDTNIHWILIRSVQASVADWAILPLQDILSLGSEARMNQPAVSSGNWRWRFTGNQLLLEIAAALKKMSHLYGRC